MAKVVKFLDIQAGGVHLEARMIRDKAEMNPFRVGLVEFNNGYHRYQLAKYGDFMSVLCFVKDFYQAGVNVLTVPEIRDWCKRYQNGGN